MKYYNISLIKIIFKKIFDTKNEFWMQQYQIMTFPRLLLGSQIDQNSEEELVFFFGILECRHIFCVNIIWPSVSVWRVLHQTCTGFTIYGDWKCLIKRIKAIFVISFLPNSVDLVKHLFWGSATRAAYNWYRALLYRHDAAMFVCLIGSLPTWHIAVRSENIFNVIFFKNTMEIHRNQLLNFGQKN